MMGVREQDAEYARTHVSAMYMEGCLVLYLHENRGGDVVELRATEDARILVGRAAGGEMRCLVVPSPQVHVFRFASHLRTADRPPTDGG